VSHTSNGKRVECFRAVGWSSLFIVVYSLTSFPPPPANGQGCYPLRDVMESDMPSELWSRTTFPSDKNCVRKPSTAQMTMDKINDYIESFWCTERLQSPFFLDNSIYLSIRTCRLFLHTMKILMEVLTRTMLLIPEIRQFYQSHNGMYLFWTETPKTTRIGIAI
jgi:hypothetical protein